MGANRLESPGCGGTRHGHDGEQYEWRGDGGECGAIERPRDDTSEQNRLRQDEQGSDDPKQGIDAERDAGGTRATEEATGFKLPGTLLCHVTTAKPPMATATCGAPCAR